jgi:hypothetical protein
MRLGGIYSHWLITKLSSLHSRRGNFLLGNSLTHTGRIQGKSLQQGRKEEKGIGGLLSVHYASMDK